MSLQSEKMSKDEHVDVNNSSVSTFDNAPPEFQASDYGEIALLAILIMVGGPLNFRSLFRTLRAAGYFEKFSRAKRGASKNNASLSRRRFHCSSSSSFKTGDAPVHHRQGGKINHRLTTFKLHLTSANLLIVFGYGFSQFIWLCTYSWRGGDFLCKLTKFLHIFCFYATSNLVASIAVDRLHVTLNVDRPSTVANRRRSRAAAALSSASNVVWLRRLVWGAWILAFVSSVPQFFLWRTFTPFQDEAPEWRQCVTIWMTLLYTDDQNDHENSALEDVAFYERIYGAVHLTLVFWIPVLVIAICYALILAQLHRKIVKSNKDLRHICKYRRESDAVTFRKRCENMHRASVCSLGSSSDAVDGRHEFHPSPGLLMELPIVISSAQPFICQPLLESFAVVTLTKAKKNTMKKTAWILMAYVICWSPYNVLELYRYLINPEFENVYLEFLSNLIVFNAVVNPLIYDL